MVNQYNINDYETIRSNGFTYQLPEAINTIIQKLICDLGVISTSSFNTSTTDFANPRFHPSDRHSKFKKSRNERTSNRKGIDTTWEKQPEFIPTKIEKKEGTEKLINDIRISLNKISTKNYDTHRDTIFQNIDNIIDDDFAKDDSQTEEIDKIASAIFNIASTNKFYSLLYATLYKELTDKYPIFGDIIQTFISTTYISNVNLIEYVDETKDYEKHCLMNKENDKRKSMTVFIVNLMKKNLVSKDNVTEFILYLQNLILKYIDEPSKTYVVEEITENIFLFLTSCDNKLISTPTWNSIVENVKTCSQLKVKEHPSISSRAIFKYKDMVDLFTKL